MSGKQPQCHPSLARPPHLERAEPQTGLLFCRDENREGVYECVSIPRALASVCFVPVLCWRLGHCYALRSH